MVSKAEPSPRRRKVMRDAVAGIFMLALVVPVMAGAQGPSPVAAAFGNTVVSTYPDGRHQLIWFQADGRWSGVARTGKSLAGRWRLDDQGRVCLRQTNPPTLPISMCQRMPTSVQIGSTWTSKDFLGRKINLSLVNGLNPGEAKLASLATPSDTPATP